MHWRNGLRGRTQPWRDRVPAIRYYRSPARLIPAGENTPLGSGTFSQRARTRALPGLFLADAAAERLLGLRWPTVMRQNAALFLISKTAPNPEVRPFRACHLRLRSTIEIRPHARLQRLYRNR